MATAKKEATIPTREEVLERARAIAPRLRERAEACDAARMVPVETIEDYREAGLFRLAMPRRYSGYELGWDVLCEVSQILAAACGSQAWIQRICADHAEMVAGFPPQTQDEVWGEDHDVIISAAFDPVGRARPTEGGWIFSGRHGFSSGIDHCVWHICGGYIEEDDGSLDGPHFFLVPRQDVTIIDDWHVMGLAGTGSKSFEVKEAFVPAHRFLDGPKARLGITAGQAVNKAAVFRTPRGGITSTGFAALAVGMARGVIQDWIDYTRPRKSRGTPIADKQSTQIIAARSAAELDAAEALYLGTIRRAMAVLEEGGSLSAFDLATSRRNVAFACKTALKAGTRVFNAAGGRALFAPSSMERQYRNLLGAAAHHGVVWDVAATAWGKLVMEGEDW
ncbi:MAG: acyl-CoA dehydrogenase family protein [Alphaproteobacteria bacterium]|nr:acyl-CoA dehydrogenase family protein [Alphaproteobacteria bacterium]